MKYQNQIKIASKQHGSMRIEAVHIDDCELITDNNAERC
jgi:hypothetical protein